MNRSRRASAVLIVLVVSGAAASEAQSLRSDLAETLVPLGELASGGFWFAWATFNPSTSIHAGR